MSLASAKTANSHPGSVTTATAPTECCPAMSVVSGVEASATSAVSAAQVCYPATMRVAVPDGPASWMVLCFVLGARYPRRSFQLRSPGWRETKASVSSSQILQEPCGSSATSCTAHANNSVAKLRESSLRCRHMTYDSAYDETIFPISGKILPGIPETLYREATPKTVVPRSKSISCSSARKLFPVRARYWLKEKAAAEAAALCL